MTDSRSVIRRGPQVPATVPAVGGYNPPVPVGGTAVAVAREQAEVLVRVQMARLNPRDEDAAIERILKACRRLSLAQQAFYEYPRGKIMVRGPSIRLAEVLAINWGNLAFSIRELERRPGESDMLASCWDLQTNTSAVRCFVACHRRDTQGGGVDLTDERDIYELTTNLAARRLRAAILEMIPADVVELAINECEKTLAAAPRSRSGPKPKAAPFTTAVPAPPETQVERMVDAFRDLGVSEKRLEVKLGHAIGRITKPEYVELVAVYNILKAEGAGVDLVDFYLPLGDTPLEEVDTETGEVTTVVDDEAEEQRFEEAVSNRLPPPPEGRLL
jgi:hypothetical protein